MNDINAILKTQPDSNGLKVTSVTWSSNGNAILTTLPSQSASELNKFAHLFADVYRTDNLPSAGANPDQKWAKVIVHTVDTGKDNTGRLRNPEEMC
jgi:hypothetical protein